MSDPSLSGDDVLRSDPNLLDPDVEAPVAMLDDFEILQKLATAEGVSSFLAVRRGALGFSKRVMLKVADAPIQQALAVALRLTDEARLGMRLAHPNLLQTLDLGRDGDRFFVVREWVDGLGLRRLMHQVWGAGEVVPLAVSLRIGIHVCRALEYLHGLRVEPWASEGIVHRAVTPSNILLSRAGEVRLATLFMARPAGVETATDTEEARPIPAYTAPERLRGLRGSPTADLFSLAAVLYEAIAGPAAFEGSTESDWSRFRDDAVLAASIGALDCHPALRAILGDSLAGSPSSRPATATELKDRLRAWQLDELRDDGDQALRDLVNRFAG